jgi:uncharacterized repeat protein (TIGR03837 family)
MISAPTCDIFCCVIDNFGDAGFAWRLAKELRDAQAFDAIRLFITDLGTLAAICPDADPSKEEQRVQGITVCAWSEADGAQVADVVLETFGCRIPEAYEERIGSRPVPPLWINVEYLSAESWVPDWHMLPSPHPRFNIDKFYFYPGLREKTGGVLFSPDILGREDHFMRYEKSEFCRRYGIDESLWTLYVFCYPGPWVTYLAKALVKDPRPVQLLLAPGAARDDLLSLLAFAPGITTVNLPYFDQDDFEKPLWVSNALVVRGEDSFVRAQTAAKPFLWNIYPIRGDETTHMKKLAAFFELYAPYYGQYAELVKDVNTIFNTGGNQFPTFWTIWRTMVEEVESEKLQTAAAAWREHLFSLGSLSENLLAFIRSKGFCR